MNLVIALDQIRDEDRQRVGGKGFALARMRQSGMPVPDAVCIPKEAYHEYVGQTGLRMRILQEVDRKPFADMRWEELWDASLRIRNHFLHMPIPAGIADRLTGPLGSRFKDKAVAVRSSAPGEDAAQTSFAGLHASYLNVRGTDAIVRHVLLVWSSLWSDAALLYRQELKLDVSASSMAVVIQELVQGDRSGVAFGESPTDASRVVIESVYGLNQGLVDGTVEPDRWILDRSTGTIVSHVPAQREKAVVPAAEGVRLEPLAPAQAGQSPLTDADVAQVFRLVQNAETFFQAPQDMEWTFRGDELYVLQSRPITTGAKEDEGDNRSWYLSLRRSFDNLTALRNRIEEELIPAMLNEAEAFAGIDLASLDDKALLRETGKRMESARKWKDIYWKEFIPFAHGMRLFGQTYNDAVRPDDPYEFMDLLVSGELESLERNRMLEQMAAMVRQDPDLERELREQGTGNEAFNGLLKQFALRYGPLGQAGSVTAEPVQGITGLILEIAGQDARAARSAKGRKAEDLSSPFIASFREEEQELARALIDLGRASYRLRDNDNIYLERITRELQRALAEITTRLEKGGMTEEGRPLPPEITELLSQAEGPDQRSILVQEGKAGFALSARQIVGQPAGPGIASGTARVIRQQADLFQFKRGEVLVCDAVDPTMTFVVPLSAGIVERRGGMLIHGAIIAREYGIPCVTGVPDATGFIRTGQTVTDDGYLGIVIGG